MASIFTRSNRRLPYMVGWREPETNKQRWKSFAKKREAEDFREKVGQVIRGGIYVSPKPKAFKEYALDWLERKCPTVSPNGHGVHRWAVEGHLIPEFGLTPIQGIRPERIERFQARLLKAGHLSARSVQIIRQVLSSILKDARKKGLLLSNPMEAVDPIEVPKRALRFLTVEQIAGLCRLAGPMYGTLFAVQALCGLRAGEILALRWEDVDLVAGRLFVRRQVVWLRKKDVPAGEPSWRFADPKSEAGNRVIEIPAPLARGLEQYRQWRNGAVRPDALLFSTKDGTPLMQRNIRRRHFQPALKALGLADIRPHDFRRSFVALHVAAGTHPKLVQTRMGHSSIGLTMDVYGKLAGDIALGKEEAARLNGLAEQAVTDLANIWQTGASETSQKGHNQTGGKKALTP